MGVDDSDGHLLVNKRYLSTGRKQDIYLDIVHELCHVKQHMEGRELFDPRYDYVDRPTEIEAYRYAVKEAKRIGFSAAEIRVYLQTEMMSTKALDRLIKNMGVDL
jgi:predicted SprT family Zn-dependent metalloprotease